ncbi:MAG: hypothetical protein ACC726_11635, partial [Chloroflexota bacterium]
MSSDRDATRGRFLPHEYSSEPGPYRLPEPTDEKGGSLEERPRRSRHARGMLRGWRTFSVPALVLVLVASLGVGMAVSSNPRQLLVIDSFDRPDASRLGTTDNGLQWIYPEGPAGFGLSAKNASITLSPSKAFRRAVVGRANALDVTVRFTFSLDRMPAGDGVKVMGIMRRSPG